MNKRTGLAVGLGLALSMASAASWAEDRAGWYFGVTGGQAEIDINKAAYDSILLSAIPGNVALLSSSSTLDDSDTSVSLVGGYRVSPYFALEAGYIDAGTAKYRASAVVDPIGLPPQAVSLAIDFEGKGFTAAAMGFVPVGHGFDLHGQAGILFADGEVTVRGSSSSFSASDSVSANSQDFFYGLGVGFQLGQNWTFSFDWQQFKDAGDDEETGEADVNRLSLGVIYRL